MRKYAIQMHCFPLLKHKMFAYLNTTIVCVMFGLDECVIQLPLAANRCRLSLLEAKFTHSKRSKMSKMLTRHSTLRQQSACGHIRPVGVPNAILVFVQTRWRQPSEFKTDAVFGRVYLWTTARTLGNPNPQSGVRYAVRIRKTCPACFVRDQYIR